MINQNKILLYELFKQAKNGTLCDRFSEWELCDEKGWTIAHEAAKYNNLPENFNQYYLSDNDGTTVDYILTLSKCGFFTSEYQQYYKNIKSKQNYKNIKSKQNNESLRMLLPIDRSPYAIAAGYFGLLSILIVFAPLAIFFGIMGIYDIQKNKDKYGMGRCVFGIVSGGIVCLMMLISLLVS